MVILASAPERGAARTLKTEQKHVKEEVKKTL
jgi:hypothetical protein